MAFFGIENPRFWSFKCTEIGFFFDGRPLRGLRAAACMGTGLASAGPAPIDAAGWQRELFVGFKDLSGGAGASILTSFRALKWLL